MATREAGHKRIRPGRPSLVCQTESADPCGAAAHCLMLVQEAAECASPCESSEIAGATNNSFDIMAINSATVHLERDLVELLCFGPKENRARYG